MIASPVGAFSEGLACSWGPHCALSAPVAEEGAKVIRTGTHLAAGDAAARTGPARGRGALRQQRAHTSVKGVAPRLSRLGPRPTGSQPLPGGDPEAGARVGQGGSHPAGAVGGAVGGRPVLSKATFGLSGVKQLCQ